MVLVTNMRLLVITVMVKKDLGSLIQKVQGWEHSSTDIQHSHRISHTCIGNHKVNVFRF
jgi:hypothetical protein